MGGLWFWWPEDFREVPAWDERDSRAGVDRATRDGEIDCHAYRIDPKNTGASVDPKWPQNVDTGQKGAIHDRP
jgi:hypothetical protein